MKIEPEKPATEPKPYSPPKMVLLGSVRDLTLGTGSYSTERSGGKAKSMM